MSRSLGTLLLIISALLYGTDASWEKLVHEINLRQEVIPLLQEKCGSELEVQKGVQRLHQGIKQSRHSIAKKFADPRIFERPQLIARPNEVNAIVLHLCETKLIGQDLLREIQWFESSNLSYQTELNEDTEDTGENSGGIDEGAIEKIDEKRESLITFSMVETFLLGLLLGSVLTHYLVLVKNSSISPQIVSKLRRPEL